MCSEESIYKPSFTTKLQIPQGLLQCNEDELYEVKLSVYYIILPFLSALIS